MKHKGKLIIMLLVITLLPLVVAQQVYQEDMDVDLKVPCFNNNTYCSSSATCNITIIDFNGDAIVDDRLMTQQTAYHNYTLNTSDTQNSGEYRVSIICDDNGLLGHTTFEYIITPTGKSLNTSSAIIQGLILIIMFGVTIFFLVFAKITEVDGVKLFFNVISYLTMTLTVGTGYILLQSGGVQNNVSSLLMAMIYLMGVVLIIIMYYIFINQTRYVLALMRAKRGFGSEIDNPPTF